MPNEITQSKTPITEQVMTRLDQIKESQGLSLPKTYNPANALNAAYLAMQKVKGIEHTTPASQSKALLDMVLQALSPAKDQCYFIAYGNQLQMQRSYFGSVAAVKRISGVQKVRAEVVHQGDTFELGTDDDMDVIVKKFEPQFANQDKPIVGAFALIKTNEGRFYTVMTKKEIDQSWAQTRQKNNRVQQNFSQEMAKRTVLNRAAKMFINTSDDSDLLTGAINDTTENEYDDSVRKDVTPHDKQAEQAKLLAAKATGQEVKEDHGNNDETKEPEEADGQTDIYDFIDQSAEADAK